MIDSLFSFLGHGGFKLLFFAVIVVANLVKSRAKIARDREAAVRGPATISDFSVPETAPHAVPQAQSAPLLSTPDLKPIAKRAALRAPISAPAPTSSLGSPWSSNQNPFDNSSQS